MKPLAVDEDDYSHDKFRDVFVIRSFRESHLDQVNDAIEKAVSDFESGFWVKMKPGSSREAVRRLRPYQVIDCTSRRPEPLVSDILDRISNSAIVIVILDGLRRNVVFELGFLYAIGKPFILLKHERYGPPFPELDMLFSDFKGINVTSYNFPNTNNGQAEEQFKSLIHQEMRRCEDGFTQSLNSYSAIRLDHPNLISSKWTDLSQSESGHSHFEGALYLRSFSPTDLRVTQHVSTLTCLMIRFQLKSENSAFSAFLEIEVDDGLERAIWFGYSSNTSVGRRCYPDEPEITVPLAVSGPGDYMLVDNIIGMVRLRTGRSFCEGLMVKRIRLRGNDDEETIVTEVRLGSGRAQLQGGCFPSVIKVDEDNPKTGT